IFSLGPQGLELVMLPWNQLHEVKKCKIYPIRMKMDKIDSVDLFTLPKDLCSVPSTHRAAHNHLHATANEACKSSHQFTETLEDRRMCWKYGGDAFSRIQTENLLEQEPKLLKNKTLRSKA
ncbi:hypothetical protein STEG23_013490, partial [Scotinomys teguina]